MTTTTKTLKTTGALTVTPSPATPRALVFDIEADGLLQAEGDKREISKVHCIVTQDTATGKVSRYHDHSGIPSDGSLVAGLRALEAASAISGHSIQAYDIPALQRFYPDFKPQGRVIDTLVMSRLCWTDLKTRDWQRIKTNPAFPKQLIGRHSLESWGWRLNEHKGDFGLLDAWDEFSPEMLEYCVQDVRITARLYALCMAMNYPEACVEREHKFAEIIDHQMRWGIELDRPAALKLVERMQVHRAELEVKIKPLFPDFTDKYVTPKKKIEKIKTTIFNPRSRQHIARHLMERQGWQPEEYTESGEPKLDEDVLKGLQNLPGMPLLAEHFDVQRRLATVAEGNTNWLSLAGRDGRLRGYVNHNGARTHRCSHSRPNMTQAPRVGTLYGAECRALLRARDGWKLVGCDAQQLELRCFAHYCSRYDNGEYTRLLLNEDIHTVNQKAAGLDTRNQSKKFIYAFLYGAGDENIGNIVGGGRAAGKALRERFFAAMPGAQMLLNGIYSSLAKRGHLVQRNGRWKLSPGAYVVGIDGRRVPIGKINDILNTLLQSCGAIVLKEATVGLQSRLRSLAVHRDRDYGNALHVHDELQLEVRDAYAALVAQEAPKAIEQAGRTLGLLCPLAGKASVGQTWADTH